MKNTWDKLKKIRWYLSFMFAAVCLIYVVYQNNYSQNPRIISEYVSIRDGGNFNRVPFVDSDGKVLKYTKYAKEFVANAPGTWKEDFVIDLVAYNELLNNNNIATDIVIACKNKNYKELNNLRLLAGKTSVLNGYRTTWAPIKKEECDSFTSLYYYGHSFYDTTNAISLWWVAFWLLLLPCFMKIVDFLMNKMDE